MYVLLSDFFHFTQWFTHVVTRTDAVFLLLLDSIPGKPFLIKQVNG